MPDRAIGGVQPGPSCSPHAASPWRALAETVGPDGPPDSKCMKKLALRLALA
jgi:hypothetical protein